MLIACPGSAFASRGDDEGSHGRCWEPMEKALALQLAPAPVCGACLQARGQSLMDNCSYPSSSRLNGGMLCLVRVLHSPPYPVPALCHPLGKAPVLTFHFAPLEEVCVGQTAGEVSAEDWGLGWGGWGGRGPPFLIQKGELKCA